MDSESVSIDNYSNFASGAERVLNVVSLSDIEEEKQMKKIAGEIPEKAKNRKILYRVVRK